MLPKVPTSCNDARARHWHEPMPRLSLLRLPIREPRRASPLPPSHCRPARPVRAAAVLPVGPADSVRPPFQDLPAVLPLLPSQSESDKIALLISQQPAAQPVPVIPSSGQSGKRKWPFRHRLFHSQRPLPKRQPRLLTVSQLELPSPRRPVAWRGVGSPETWNRLFRLPATRPLRHPTPRLAHGRRSRMKPVPS